MSEAVPRGLRHEVRYRIKMSFETRGLQDLPGTMRRLGPIRSPTQRRSGVVPEIPFLEA